MKKIKKAILFFSSLVFVSIIIQGCCNDEFKIIGSGTASILTIDTYESLDTIRGPFMIQAVFDAEIAGNFYILGLFNTAYALSCEEPFVNRPDTNTLKIYSDKNFVYNGDTIVSNSDFSFLNGLDVQVYEYSEGILYISFTEDFMNEASFDNSTYNFTFEIETDDGLMLKNEVSAAIQL